MNKKIPKIWEDKIKDLLVKVQIYNLLKEGCSPESVAKTLNVSRAKVSAVIACTTMDIYKSEKDSKEVIELFKDTFNL